MTRDKNINEPNNAGLNLPGPLLEQKEEKASPEGVAQVTSWQFGDILATHTRGNLKNTDLQAPGESAILFFSIKGRTTLNSSGYTFTLASGEHNILFIKNRSVISSLDEFTHETFLIMMPIKIFRQFCADLSSVNDLADRSSSEAVAVIPENNLHMDVALYHSIREILYCSLTGTLRSLFIYARLTDLIVLQLASIQRANSNTSIFCRSDYDRERITFARDYLIQHTELPPSLTELSRIAGINEFKLKRGFKEMFGTTVFGYLAEHRLALARHDIMEGKKTATEIAFELGYASPQHFSKAFKQKYGISPKRFK